MQSFKEAALVVDAASMSAVAAFLESTTSADQWSEQTAWRVAIVANRFPHFAVAASPGPARLASGNYELVTEALRVVAGKQTTADQESLDAIAQSKRWVRARVPSLRKYLTSVLKTDPKFKAWLDWSVRSAWVEHANRLGGMFNELYLPEIAKVLNCSEKELTRLHQQTLDSTWLTQMVKKRKPEADYDMLTDAYVVAALIRGYYHDLIARTRQHQILHHPMRQSFLETFAKDYVSQEQPIEQPNVTEIGWAQLLLQSARNGHTTRERVAIFRDNLIRAKTSELSIDLSAKSSERNLEATLYQNAKVAGIVAHSKAFENACAAAASLLFGAPLVALNPYLGLGVAVATATAQQHFDTGTVIPGYLTSRRVKSLAKSAAGRVSLFRSL